MRYHSAEWLSSLFIFVGSLVSIAPFRFGCLIQFRTDLVSSYWYNISPLFTQYWVRRVCCTWKNCFCTCSIACNSLYCLGSFRHLLDRSSHVALCPQYLSFMSLFISSWDYSLILSWDLLLVMISMGSIGTSCTSVFSLVLLLEFAIYDCCESPTSSSWKKSWAFVFGYMWAFSVQL